MATKKQKRYLRIEAIRDDYGPVMETMTVGQLKELLENFEDDLPIYLSHDRGYTYGYLSEKRIEEAKTEDD